MEALKSNRRCPEYLSPSALGTYESNKTEYYIRYIAPTKAPRMQQTQPMSVGSAFDAFVKSYLHEKIYGKGHHESNKYELTTIFESQVEPANRDWALDAGRYTFEKYKESGALSDLMMELSSASDDPRFEFEVRGVVHAEGKEPSREGVSKKTQGVTLLGKPDLRYVNSQGAHVVHDWKVNGYCGKGNTSPTPGYVMCREHDIGVHWKRMGSHKDAFIQPHKGLMVNTGAYLEQYKEDWATQLATYGWLLGEKVGVEMICSVDQIVGNGMKRDSAGHPALRMVSHRIRVSSKFQFEAIARYQELWGILHDEPFYFFRDMSFEASAQKCALLDEQCLAMGDPTLTPEEKWVFDMGRKQ